MPRIMVVDDDPEVQAFVRHALQGEDYQIDCVEDAVHALTYLADDPPDLVILDMDLSGEDSLGILKVFQRDRRYDMIPIVLLSAQDDLDDKVRGLEFGAVDYLVAPVHERELAARVRTQIRLKERHDEVFSEYQRLSKVSLTDPLTGAYNRRALDNLLQARLAESERHNIPVSCVMFDLDHFKRVNDTYGHSTGDMVLRETAGVAISLFRKEDSLFRYGGEEFLIILFHAHKDGACIFAERLREAIAAQVFQPNWPGQAPFVITVSAGVATFPDDTGVDGAEEMIVLADKRLYAAKTGGRDRVVSEGCYDPS